MRAGSRASRRRSLARPRRGSTAPRVATKARGGLLPCVGRKRRQMLAAARGSAVPRRKRLSAASATGRGDGGSAVARGASAARSARLQRRVSSGASREAPAARRARLARRRGGPTPAAPAVQRRRHLPVRVACALADLRRFRAGARARPAAILGSVSTAASSASASMSRTSSRPAAASCPRSPRCRAGRARASGPRRAAGCAPRLRPRRIACRASLIAVVPLVPLTGHRNGSARSLLRQRHVVERQQAARRPPPSWSSRCPAGTRSAPRGPWRRARS